MANSQNPRYVEYGGQQSFCHPLQCQGVRFYSFVFEADPEALQALCDRRLNDPSGNQVEYRPLLPRVLLGVADIEQARCQNPPYSEMGWMTEIDVAFWVPVAAVKRIAGVLPVAERLAWFMPFVFVDNCLACASGREVFGFQKAVGQFQVPQGPQEPVRVAVDTFVVERFGPQPSQARQQRLLEVGPVSAQTGGTLATVWTEIEKAFDDFLSVLLEGGGGVTLPGLGLVVQAEEFLSRREVPLVFLKQFRDVTDGTRACYQAVVEAPARLTAFRTARRLAGQYQLTVSPCDGCPIVAELGLNGSRPQVLGAWYTEFDFVMESGSEVWKA